MRNEDDTPADMGMGDDSYDRIMMRMMALRIVLVGASAAAWGMRSLILNPHDHHSDGGGWWW